MVRDGFPQWGSMGDGVEVPVRVAPFLQLIITAVCLLDIQIQIQIRQGLASKAQWAQVCSIEAFHVEEMLKGLTICSVTSKQFNVEFECSYDVSAWSVQHNPMQKCRITWGWGVGGGRMPKLHGSKVHGVRARAPVYFKVLWHLFGTFWT